MADELTHWTEGQAEKKQESWSAKEKKMSKVIFGQWRRQKLRFADMAAFGRKRAMTHSRKIN